MDLVTEKGSKEYQPNLDPEIGEPFYWGGYARHHTGVGNFS